MTNNKKLSAKPWGGRFTEATDSLVEAFTASVEFDRKLYKYDIEGSIAHAKMLTKAGILTQTEEKAIIDGLNLIYTEIEEGTFNWSIGLEDVHMNIEANLVQKIGDIGKKLHTARSRNDQVATDLRLYAREAIDEICHTISQLQLAIVTLAEREKNTIMPGFTHLQPAQPISFGHHVLAWYEMLERDYQRLQDSRKRVNTLPLGAAALAGSSYPINREHTAQLLGFDSIALNSLDAVSDRDFVIETTSALSLIMSHLSRISEEIILWSSQQFNFVELPDRFCTGSSIMPQKKNPDVPELIRGKTGRVTGHLMSLFMLMKAQPLAYNKDNQEDKEPFFDSIETTHQCLILYTQLLNNLKVNREITYLAAQDGFTTATDLADYLVKQGIPFRDAHEVVGKTVSFCINANKKLSELTITELQQFSPKIQDDVYDYLTLEGSINSRNHLGGTALNQVALRIKEIQTILAKR